MISEKLSTDSRRMLQNGVPQFAGFCRCTPRRQRRGKVCGRIPPMGHREDAPRAGSAEAKKNMDKRVVEWFRMHPAQAAPRQSAYRRRDWHLWSGCTPRRQRRGKDPIPHNARRKPQMHPAQAAPRQSSENVRPGNSVYAMHPAQAAPRQSCGTCHRRATPPRCTPRRQRRGKGRVSRLFDKLR